MSRVKMTAGLLATVLVGALSMSTVAPASAVGAQGVKDQSVAASASARRALQPGTFRVASFNVLGYSHTVNGAQGKASGTTRIVWANQLLEKHHVDVAGFQEMQVPQVKKFMEITAGKWALYPGLQLRSWDSENSVGWRTDKFDLVNATTVNIPYFDGIPRAMPIVLLRDKVSGMMSYFTNFHNPATNTKHRRQGHWRAEARRVETALHQQLAHTGIPRIMTGDMNDRDKFFCPVARQAPLHAARPQSYVRDGVCHPNRPPFVDWILGSLHTRFSGYVEDNGVLDHKTSDHPVVVATATVDPAKLPAGWATTTPSQFVPRVSWHG